MTLSLSKHTESPKLFLPRTRTLGSNHASVPKKVCIHTHTHAHTHTQSPFPPLTHTPERSRASTLTREDGGFRLAGKQRRATAKATGSSGRVPAEGWLCFPRSSRAKGAEAASCKVAGVSSAASTQIFTHKQHITQQLPFVRRNGSGRQ